MTLGILDPIAGIDAKMFVDPQRLILTKLPEFKQARAKLEKYFSDTFRLLNASSQMGDRAFEGAVERLTFKETKGVGIGFGVDTDDGRGIGPVLACQLARSAAEIQRLGVNDPAVFELLGLFEENFGADRLSDLTVLILREEFLAFTARVARELSIPSLSPLMYSGKTYLVPLRPRSKIPITLLPWDILRRLPIATDPSEIDEASYLNKDLRKFWVDLLRDAWETNRDKPDKGVRRKLFIDNPAFFPPLIKVYREDKRGPYDFLADPAGILRWADFAQEFASRFPINLPRSVTTLGELERIVRLIVEQFRKNIEDNGLNKLLYNDRNTPRREAYAQLLFFASADAYCRANGLDISPESNAGRGPVDFKISRGDIKVVVELKLSKHSRLLHGWTEQLKTYRRSEGAQRAFYVVVKVTDGKSEALERLRELENREKKAGKPTSSLVIIDGLRYPSASKT